MSLFLGPSPDTQEYLILSLSFSQWEQSSIWSRVSCPPCGDDALLGMPRAALWLTGSYALADGNRRCACLACVPRTVACNALGGFDPRTLGASSHTCADSVKTHKPLCHFWSSLCGSRPMHRTVPTSLGPQLYFLCFVSPGDSSQAPLPAGRGLASLVSRLQDVFFFLLMSKPFRTIVWYILFGILVF